MKQIKVLLWFDVEDYLTAESDDAFYDILRILDEYGVRATLKFCTKKVELLQKKGRTDILEKLKRHELCFHTTEHSIHPLPTEYLEHYGFREGTEEFFRREYPGFLKLAELTGQHLMSYGHPGVAWAPQAFAASRRMGVPTYMDAHPIMDVNGGIFWYAGLYCMTGLVNLIHSRHEPNQLEHMIRAFDEMDMRGEDVVFLSIYDHPTELVAEEFWDEVNFAGGVNPVSCRPSPLRSQKAYKDNLEALRGFLKYTGAKENVEYITATEAMRYEKQRLVPLQVSDLKEYAEGFDGGITYHSLKGGMLAPSELLTLLAKAVTGRMLVPELLYGPEKEERSIVHAATVSAQELAEAVLTERDYVMGCPQLKPLYRVGDDFLNPADLFCTLAKALREGTDTVEVQTGRLAAADHVDESYQFGGNWIVWAEDFDAPHIVEQTKLQCWTLKPAVV